MINLIKLQCPNCSANLEVANNVKQCFCTYCGTKILLDNEGERVLRLVDEAAVEKERTERLKLELALREKERKAEEERRAKEELEKAQQKADANNTKIGCTTTFAVLFGCFAFAYFVDRHRPFFMSLLLIQLILLVSGCVLWCNSDEKYNKIGMILYAVSFLLAVPLVAVMFG